MAKPLTQPEDTRTESEKHFDEMWEKGFEIKSCQIHSTINGLPATETLSDQKLPGVKLRRTPLGVQVIFRGKRVGVESATVKSWWV